MRVKNNLDTIIYDYIISSLIMGEYHMGQIISLDDLSQKYEVSRTPVTQAVKLLVKDGILEMQKNGRVKVPEMTKNDLRQICEIRLVLEEYAFKKVFLLMDEHEDAYFENLEKLAEADMKVAAANDTLQFNRYDMEFHRALISGARNVYLETEYKEIQGKFLVANYLLDSIEGRIRDVERAAKEHVAIVEAIKAKDINQCMAFIRKHVFPFEMELNEDILVQKYHYVK